MIRSVLFIVLFIVGADGLLKAQVRFDDSTAAGLALFMPEVQFCVPGGDLADRFGPHSKVGLTTAYKTSSNWTFGGTVQMTFGNQVRENDILDGISTGDGAVIDGNGQYASVFLNHRGFEAMAEFGRVFKGIGPNVNSGLWVQGGAGFVQHRIQIDNLENRAPQLIGDYLKGYDRLTNGMGIMQSVGYLHLSNNRRLNFYVGLQAGQQWTMSRRSWNFDERAQDTNQRFEWYTGLKLGFIFPAYTKAKYISDFYID